MTDRIEQLARKIAELINEAYKHSEPHKDERPFLGTLTIRNPRGGCGWTLNCGSDEVWHGQD